MIQVVAGHARHLRRDHPPEAVTDNVGPTQAQRVDDVPAEQREVEHVFDRALVLDLAVTRPERRVHGEVGAERVECWFVGRQPHETVQPDNIWAARTELADLYVDPP